MFQEMGRFGGKLFFMATDDSFSKKGKFGGKLFLRGQEVVI